MLNRMKRLMAILITLIMVFNALPVSAFAALAEGGNENVDIGAVVEAAPVDEEVETVEEELVDYSRDQKLPVPVERPVLMDGETTTLTINFYAIDGVTPASADMAGYIFLGAQQNYDQASIIFKSITVSGSCATATDVPTERTGLGLFKNDSDQWWQGIDIGNSNSFILGNYEVTRQDDGTYKAVKLPTYTTNVTYYESNGTTPIQPPTITSGYYIVAKKGNDWKYYTAINTDGSLSWMDETGTTVIELPAISEFKVVKPNDASFNSCRDATALTGTDTYTFTLNTTPDSNNVYQFTATKLPVYNIEVIGNAIPSNLYVYASVQRNNNNNEQKTYYKVFGPVSANNKTFDLTDLHINNSNPADINYAQTDTVTVRLVNATDANFVNGDSGAITGGTVIDDGASYGGYTFTYDNSTSQKTQITLQETPKFTVSYAFQDKNGTELNATTGAGESLSGYSVVVKVKHGNDTYYYADNASTPITPTTADWVVTDYFNNNGGAVEYYYVPSDTATVFMVANDPDDYNSLTPIESGAVVGNYQLIVSEKASGCGANVILKQLPSYTVNLTRTLNSNTDHGDLTDSKAFLTFDREGKTYVAEKDITWTENSATVTFDSSDTFTVSDNSGAPTKLTAEDIVSAKIKLGDTAYGNGEQVLTYDVSVSDNPETFSSDIALTENELFQFTTQADDISGMSGAYYVLTTLKENGKVYGTIKEVTFGTTETTYTVSDFTSIDDGKAYYAPGKNVTVQLLKKTGDSVPEYSNYVSNAKVYDDGGITETRKVGIALNDAGNQAAVTLSKINQDATEHKVTLEFYDKTETTKGAGSVPDGTNDKYYIMAYLTPVDSKKLADMEAYAILSVGATELNVTDPNFTFGTDTQFDAVDANKIATGEHVVYDPSEFHINFRVYHYDGNDNLSTYADLADKAHDFIDGYDYFYNEQEENKEETVIRLKSAYNKDYTVQLISDKSIDFSGSNTFLYVKVEHNRTDHTYYLQSLEGVSITAGTPTNIKITAWKDKDGKDKQNEKFTGNETVNAYILRQTGNSAPTLAQITSNQPNVFKIIPAGERVGANILKEYGEMTHSEPEGEDPNKVIHYYQPITFEKIDTDNLSQRSILGEAYGYGIWANLLEQTGEHDVETNFAAGTYQLDSVNYVHPDLSNNAGNFIVGEIKDQLIFNLDAKTTSTKVYVPEDQKSKISVTGEEMRDKIIYQDPAPSKDALQGKVSNLVSRVKSVGLSLLDKQSIKLPADEDVLDVTAFGENDTIYVDADSHLMSLFNGNDQLKIKKKPGQTIIFNVASSDPVTLGKISVDYNNSGTYTNIDLGTDKTIIDNVASHIIWNMPNVTKVTSTANSATGTFLAPSAHVLISGTSSSGWLVANTVKTRAEWHNVNRNVNGPDEYTKELVGRNIENEQFTFKRTNTIRPEGAAEIAEVTTTNDDKGNFRFSEVTYDKAGTYVFKVEEVVPSGVTKENPTKDNITYDFGYYLVTVKVSERNNRLVVDSIDHQAYDADGHPVTGTTENKFTNTYTAPDKGSITVNKAVLLNGAADTSAAGKKIKLGLYSNRAGTARVGNFKTITLDDQGRGSATFEDLDFETYYVYEIGDDGNPVTGDKATINQIKYEVTNTGTEGTQIDATNKDKTVEITNSRTTTGLSLTKSVTGGTLNADDTFTFEITLRQDADQILHPGATYMPVLGTFDATWQTGGQSSVSSVTFEENEKDNTSSKATVTLKDQQTVTISGIPAGAYYSVTETKVNGTDFGNGSTAVDGYTCTEVTKEGIIASGALTAVTITNTRTVTVGALKFQKKVTGNDAPDKKFPFTLYFWYQRGNDAVMPDSISLKYRIKNESNEGTEKSVTLRDSSDSSDLQFGSPVNTYNTVALTGLKLQKDDILSVYDITPLTKDGNKLHYALVEDDYSSDNGFAGFTDMSKGDGKGLTGEVTADALPADSAAQKYNNKYETTSLTLTKNWNDGNNQDGIRPNLETYKTKLHLYAGTTDVTTTYSDNITVTANGQNAYTVSVRNLPKNANGTTITYTMTEDSINGYTPDTTDAQGNNGSWTNSHEVGKTSVSITKSWADANDQDGMRPTAAQYTGMVHLYVNGTVDNTKVPTVTDNGDGTYTVTFSDLDEKAGGQTISYTVKEDNITGYNASTTEALANGETITNSHATEKTSISITKTWADQNDKHSLRPTAKQYANMVHLYVNGTVDATKTATVTDNGDATYTVTYSGLDKYAAGKLITYTVKEDNITGYTPSTTAAIANGGALTNTLDVGSLELKKTVEGTEDKTKEFTFEVTLTAPTTGVALANSYPAVKTDKDGNTTQTTVTISGGKVTPDVVLKADETLLIKDLPAGTGYTVKETNIPTGYKKSSPSSDATGGTIVKDDTAKVEFVNSYAAENSTTLVLNKKIAGREFKKGDKWTFTVTADPATAPMPDPASITVEPVSGTETPINFGTIKYTKADLNGASSANYTYTIKETGNVKYVQNDVDKQVHVSVTDKGDGTLEVKQTETANELVFANKYDKGNLEVVKTVETASLAEPNKAFAFTVTLKDGDKVAEDITGTYGDMTFTKGVATFELKAGEKKTATDLPANIGYTVTEETYDGWTTKAVNANGTIAGSFEKPETKTATFTNTYAAKGEIVLTALKVLEAGDRKLKADEFSFELKDAKGKTLQTKQNAADGTVTFDKIEYQLSDMTANPTELTYTISEVKGSDKTVIYDTHEEKITVTLTDKGDGTITATADPTGTKVKFTNKITSVKVNKTDVADGKELAGAKIEIRDKDGNVVDTWISKKDEIHEVTGLKTGETYTLHEEVAPDGYTIAADTTFRIDETGKVTSTGTVTKDGVMLVEDAKTSVKVSKVDVADSKELAGAKIQIIDSKGNVVSEWISTKEAKEITGLKTGETYTLHEEVAPDGYKLTSDTTFSINEDGSLNKGTTKTTDKNGETVMLVEDDRAKKPEFEKKIKDTNDTTGETSGWQDSADYDIGDAVPYKLTAKLADNVSDYVKYHITFKDEMEKGLTFDKIASVKVNGTETKAYTLTKASDQKFELRLDWEAEKAAGKYTGKLPASLNGATVEVEFTATLNSDAVLGNQGNVNKAKLEYSNNSKVETDKETGEEKPSEDTEETEEDSVIAFTYVVEVNKVDESGKALTGAAFKLEKVLKDGSKAIIKTVEAKPESVFTFKGLDDGDYILTETTAPKGYKVIGEIKFTVKAGHKVAWNGETRTTILESLTGDVTTGALKLTADLAAGKLTGDVKNEKPSVKVSKVDVANGEELEGAKIQIIDSKGNVVDEWTSGEKPHEITGLKTGEEYTLRETVAPEGYTVTTDTTFSIDENGKVTSTGTVSKDGMLLVEDAKTSVKVSKVDVANGEELEGAKIQIIDSEGNVVEEWTSGEKPHEITGLKTDEEYTLRETVAPEGYTVTTDTTFTIDEHGKVTTTGSITEEGILLVEDAKTSVKVSKVDVANGEELEGARIQIIDSKGNVVEEWTSTKKPHEITGLKTGETYTLRETVAPEGYDVTTDTTFTIDEHGKVTTTGSITEGGILLVEDARKATAAPTVAPTVAPTATPIPTTNISGRKIWVDESNKHNVRPDSITVELLADGTPVETEPVWTDTKGNTWKYIFRNVPAVTADGTEIIYTVREKPVENYETSIEGTDITNKLIPKESEKFITISGTKTWIDNNNADVTRPESITVQLMVEGKEAYAVEVKADEKGNWTYAFEDIPADDGFGNEITYELREKSVPGYFTQIKGNDLINTLFELSQTETSNGDTPKGTDVTNRNTATPGPDFGSKGEGELEELFDLFDYNTPLWGMMGTGDETPVYPYVFGGVGVLAVVALLVFSKKRKKTRQ